MKNLNKLHFPGQEPDEIIIMALRRHTMAIARKIFEFVIGAVLPIILFFLGRQYTDWLDDNTSLVYILFFLLAGLAYLFILLFMYHAWVDYYLDIWIITDKRVVAIEQKGLFHRVVSELRLNRIQDVSAEMKGFFPTLFKYGTVHVQTASEEDKFWFSEVPRPEAVARKILELHEQYSNPDQGQGLDHSDHQNMTTNSNHFPNSQA